MAYTINTFEQWLKAGNAKKLIPAIVVANIEVVSKWAIDNNLTKISFFEMADFRQFNQVRNKLLNNKFFRKNNRDMYNVFENAGRMYFDFLKGQAFKSVGTQEVAVAQNLSVVSEDQTKRTIAKAIIEVLKTHSPLTSSDIYKEIVSRGLYDFGAKAPWEVVYKELIRHCENKETYGYKRSDKYFKIVGRQDGSSLFSLSDQSYQMTDSEKLAGFDLSVGMNKPTPARNESLYTGGVSADFYRFSAALI